MFLVVIGFVIVDGVYVMLVVVLNLWYVLLLVFMCVFF